MSDIESYYSDLILRTGQGVIAFSLLPLLWGIINWKRFDKTLIIFWFYLLTSLCLYLLEQGLVWAVDRYPEYWWPKLDALHIEDTNFLRYFFQLNNFTLLGWFLYRLLQPQPIARYVKYLSVALVIAVTIHNFFNHGYREAGGFNSTVSAGYCFALPLVSMWYVYSQYNKVPLVHNPYFWINLGLIVPNLLGFFLYLAGDVIFRENFPLYAQINIAKNGLEMIGLCLTAYGFSYARNVKYLT